MPATLERWYSRGTWHREGDDARELRDASIGDVDEAARDHAARAGRIADRKARAAQRQAERDAETHEATMRLLAQLAEMDAQRAADEAAAAEREAA